MPLETTRLHLHREMTVGPVDPRVFGGFLEHMGRAVYEGVYHPESRHADAHGCRSDVLGALDRLQMTAMRYPGGNFASGYHWIDGVGPKAKRPKVRELAWQSLEPNQFGTDEYIRLCRAMPWTPMLTVNLGTGTPEEARDWVEYCNAPAGTRFSDLRAAHGSPEPHGVKLWCLGNEMDGPWQLGHVPADQYAIRAQQAAKMMKDVDKSIELVACGSCGIGMDSYMKWDRAVLEYLGDAADFISLHRYVGNPKNETLDYLAVGAGIDRQIEEMDAACRFVQAQRKSKKRAYLCFDEWNVWYKDQQMDGAGKFAPHLVEEVYNLEDALVVAGFLHSFVRHADAVKIANLAQIVNVIAPVLTRGDEMLVQSIFYPFEMMSKRRNGVSLRAAVRGPAYESKSHGTTPYVEASAILDGARLHVFLTNRHLTESAEVAVEGAGLSIRGLESAEVLTGGDAKAANSYDAPETVVARTFSNVSVAGGGAKAVLPPLAFAAITFELA
ncbi:MAG: alpha-N-arabinofuranosidase [Planctomycetota bacterium]|nr:alpha-N-arabinofuranosidase [Planctomycetota bacterium]